MTSSRLLVVAGRLLFGQQIEVASQYVLHALVVTQPVAQTSAAGSLQAILAIALAQAHQRPRRTQSVDGVVGKDALRERLYRRPQP